MLQVVAPLSVFSSGGWQVPAPALVCGGWAGVGVLHGEEEDGSCELGEGGCATIMAAGALHAPQRCVRTPARVAAPPVVSTATDAGHQTCERMLCLFSFSFAPSLATPFQSPLCTCQFQKANETLHGCRGHATGGRGIPAVAAAAAGAAGSWQSFCSAFPQQTTHTAATSSRHRRQPRVMQRGLDIGMGA